MPSQLAFLLVSCLSLFGLLEFQSGISRHQFLTVLEAGSPGQGAGRFRVWGGVSSWFIDSVFLLCPHVEEGVRGFFGVRFVRALVPFMRTPPLWPNHLPKSHPLMPLHWGLGFNIGIWRCCPWRAWLYVGSHVQGTRVLPCTPMPWLKPIALCPWHCWLSHFTPTYCSGFDSLFFVGLHLDNFLYFSVSSAFQ